MKHHKPGMSSQKLLVLILSAALSSACAAVDNIRGGGGKPGGDTTSSLPIDEKLIEALESKNIKMLITLDKDGNFVVFNTKGRHFIECDDKCIGLKHVTVRTIDSPVLLKTIRKGSAVNTQGIPSEGCKGEGCSGLQKVGMQSIAAPSGLVRTGGDELRECYVWIANGKKFEECW